MTAESFKAWRTKFQKEMKDVAAREEEEHLKALPPKEREEVRKMATKMTGRQLFERGGSVEVEEEDGGGESVDVSKYDRTAPREPAEEPDSDEEERPSLPQFSDSD